MGMGLLFSALSAGGKQLAASAEQDQRVADQKSVEAERARLEEQKALRIDEIRRQRERQGAVQMGQEITAATADLQNQRDAAAINAANGSQMTAADAAVLRNNPEARKAYGLLGSTRQTELEDRASAAEKLGYLDAARETRGQLQTEFVNQRTIKQDENADKRLDADQKWREQQAALANKREDRMASIQAAELALRRSQVAKADSRESMAAEREARMATASALRSAQDEVKQLSKELADPLLAPEQKAELQQMKNAALREVKQYRNALGGAGIEGGKGADKPFDPADFPLDGKKSGGDGKVQRVANPLASDGGGHVPAVLTPPRRAATAPAEVSPRGMAVGALDKALQETGRKMAEANARGDRAEVARLQAVFEQQNVARQRAQQ